MPMKLSVASPIDLAAVFEQGRRLVERTLDEMLSPSLDIPTKILDAMRYSIFAGGKRLRPTLVYASAEALGLAAAKASSAAAAFEMIHTYSLIHDDLPAMDDDDLRRGKPTNHKVFGEGIAILAGDALLTLAFEALGRASLDCSLPSKACAELIMSAADAAGFKGMVGGQAADLDAEGWRRKNHGFRAGRVLEYIHRHKTAALIRASVEAGAILAGARPALRRALKRYGDAIGLAFQIADDILDVTANAATLGKRGSDRDNDKLTYASLYGVESARRRALACVREAHAALKPLGPRAPALHAIADFILSRDR
jgi:geranylgeranyl diphosphate synthase type II